MQIASLSWFYRSVRRSIGAAAIVLTLDVVHSGSFLVSALFCPIWILVSLAKSAIHRPGWGLALVRILIPSLTLGIVYANDAFQLRVAEANAQRVVAACEEYHAANGRFPRNLDELVPQYMNSIPGAKYCLGSGSCFNYSRLQPMLWWEVVGNLRRIYNLDRKSVV